MASSEYQAIKAQARREQKRSQSQKDSERRWDQGFEIARPDRENDTPLESSTEFRDKRREVDELFDRRREAADIREVWE